VRVTATVINGCGGRSEIRFDARSGIQKQEDVAAVVSWVVKTGIEGARKAATAFCDTANADHDRAIRNDPAARLDAKSRGELTPNCAGDIRDELAKGRPAPTWSTGA
jgi:hypothetical protein